MLEINQNNNELFGYIANEEELRRVAEVLGRKLFPISTPDGPKMGFLIEDGKSADFWLNTFITVGSFVSFIEKYRADVPGVDAERV